MFFRRHDQREAYACYASLVLQARSMELYAACGVPDTLDGRFDAILLHLFLLRQRLKRSTDSRIRRFERSVNETFITDMDRSLREMGVGDIGVGKRVKAMGQALLGRLKAYEDAADDPATFREALTRNLYHGSAPMPGQLDMLSNYLDEAASHLTERTLEQIFAGEIFHATNNSDGSGTSNNADAA